MGNENKYGQIKAIFLVPRQATDWNNLPKSDINAFITSALISAVLHIASNQPIITQTCWGDT